MSGQPGQDPILAAIVDHYDRVLRAERDHEPVDQAKVAAELGLEPAALQAALARVEAARTLQREEENLAADRAAFEASRWVPFQGAVRRFALAMPLLVAAEVALTHDAVASGLLGVLWAVRLVWRWTRLRWPDPEAVERDFTWWRRKRQVRTTVDRLVGRALGFFGR
ncbi:MAG: hypothetical protein VKQ33_11760 [Candidatus Sericytochromatia bacterium]|nr:hypothetical protein [Candidatus Sericytochromatia bacterium]